MAVICVSLPTVKFALTSLANFTTETPVSPAPVMVIAEPGAAFGGLMPVTVRQVRGTTVKLAVCASGQPTRLIVRGPVAAFAGTVAVICVVLLIVKTAGAFAPNLTADTSLKFVPVMMTVEPGLPFVGLKPATVGQVTMPQPLRYSARMRKFPALCRSNRTPSLEV